jgi:hypothetical protein
VTGGGRVASQERCPLPEWPSTSVETSERCTWASNAVSKTAGVHFTDSFRILFLFSQNKKPLQIASPCIRNRGAYRDSNNGLGGQPPGGASRLTPKRTLANSESM